eukprot:1128697-Amphidinium_carterae.1
MDQKMDAAADTKTECPRTPVAATGMGASLSLFCPCRLQSMTGYAADLLGYSGFKVRKSEVY